MIEALDRLSSIYAGAAMTHLIVATLVLCAAHAAATWMRPLTARTRHAVLVAGLTALLLPPSLVSSLIERFRAEPPKLLVAALPNIGGVPLSLAVNQPVETSWGAAVVTIWLGVAALFFLRWLLTSRRLVHVALRSGVPPAVRVSAALERARQRLRMRRAVDIIASPLCEAPAVVRVVRPLIVVPADGCAVLDDDELESLLCHECAHVARRDNLIGVFEAVVCSLFWFHPLVWLAHHRIGTAREEACDELVADSTASAETYVGALGKFCRALIAPRVPAVSCMASAHLKERIQHLMSYPVTRKAAFSHRAVTALAMAAVVVSIVTAGVSTAMPVGEGKATPRYTLNYSINEKADGGYIIRTKIVDTKTNEVFGEPTLVTKAGGAAETTMVRDGLRMRLRFVPAGVRRLELTVHDGDGELRQTTSHPIDTQRIAQEQKYSGQPITLSLKDAEINDVLQKFATLTGLQITTAPEVKGKVTMQFVDTPWDEALDRILQEKGLRYRLEGDRMYVAPAEQLR